MPGRPRLPSHSYFSHLSTLTPFFSFLASLLILSFFSPCTYFTRIQNELSCVIINCFYPNLYFHLYPITFYFFDEGVRRGREESTKFRDDSRST